MSKTPITPLADYVLVKRDEAVSKTASGLYLPEKASEKPKTATVLAVGPAVKDVKVGDRIIYGGYSNSDIKHDGVEYVLIKNENIFATVN